MVYNRDIKFEKIINSDLYKYIKVGAIYDGSFLAKYSLDCKVLVICGNKKLKVIEKSREQYIIKKIIEDTEEKVIIVEKI